MANSVIKAVPLVETITKTGISVSAGQIAWVDFSFPNKTGFTKALTVIEKADGTGSGSCHFHLTGTQICILGGIIDSTLTVELRCLYLPN